MERTVLALSDNTPPAVKMYANTVIVVSRDGDRYT